MMAGMAERVPPGGDVDGVQRAFAALGDRIRDAWHGVGFDEDRFAAIATAALGDAALAARLTYTDLVDWALRAAQLPPQRLASGFGQPPLTMYRDERFRIDALFWRFETTAIHHHAFSGAFTVLAGSSVECTYSFAPRFRLNSRFLVGELAPVQIAMLRRGAVRPIERGSRMIHSVFHLETPSVTIVVASLGDPEVGPEYTYHPPTIALDPSDANALRTRQLQLLELLAAVRSPTLERCALDLLARCDLHTGFAVLMRLASHSGELGERMMSALRTRHGDAVDALVPALQEEHRRRHMFASRRAVADPEHRVLLALLLSMLDRPAIDAFLRAEYPIVEPAAVLERWIIDLSRLGVFGISFDDTLTWLLRACLRGDTAEQVIAQLRGDPSSGAEIGAHARDIAEACRLITHHAGLAPLFRWPRADGDAARPDRAAPGPR